MEATVHEKSRHDLSNQLAIIHGFAELLLADAAAGDPRRYEFQEIRAAAETALELVAGAFADTQTLRSPA